MIKLDYSLKTPEERMQLVKQLLAEMPTPTNQYLEYLADYVMAAIEKEERKQRKILTENRMVTVNKRETSFEGLVAQFENGEDGIYNLIKEDKHILFQPKKAITAQDLERMPDLRQVKEAIAFWENQVKTATGHNLYVIKQAIIELRKDQYVIKEELTHPVKVNYVTSSRPVLRFEGGESIGANGDVETYGISLCDPKVCSAILVNYSGLKQESYDDFNSDTWYLMQDFDRIADIALRQYPILEEIAIEKVDGVQNQEIRENLEHLFGITYSKEYISNLWRRKIPKIIAGAAQDEYLSWYYFTQARGKYKQCTRCRQIKLAHTKYFTKNSSSKDGWYSICKECRNKKRK